jgi:hypothetical protein
MKRFLSARVSLSFNCDGFQGRRRHRIFEWRAARDNFGQGTGASFAHRGQPLTACFRLAGLFYLPFRSPAFLFLRRFGKSRNAKGG